MQTFSKEIKEVRWHGRGGNGAFTAAKLMGYAASICEGKYAQAFPSFGPERRGAPVQGFTRISDETITDHSQVYSCDSVVVLDETLCNAVDVSFGLKEDGILVINSVKSADTIKKEYSFQNVERLLTIDATKIALDILGRPIVNTVMLGAIAAASSLVSLEALENAVDGMMAPALREKNKKAICYAYHLVKEASYYE